MPKTRRTSHSPRDPAESWELPTTDGDGGSSYRGICDIFPHSPRRPEDLPDGALASLNDVCGCEGLRQVFVMPPASRATGFGDQHVTTPASVLGIGTRAVALWTVKPEPGIRIAIPLERLSAIEDITVLLYGRLSFLSLGNRLTIRYNTLARFALEPALLDLRKRLAGSPQPLPRENPDCPEMPAKWVNLLRSPLLRFHEQSPVAFQFAMKRGRTPQDLDRGQLLLVNPHELVYMCDPPAVHHNYGEDSFIIPRLRISRVRVRERYLEVAANGSRFTLTMAPELREAAARWFA